MTADYIKQKTGLARFLGKGAVTIGNNIYFPKGIYHDLISDVPSVNNIAWLKHEEEHRLRQQEIGTRRWWRKYLLNRNFRLQEELSAFRTQIDYLRANGHANDVVEMVNTVANKLSGVEYFWAGRREHIINYFQQSEII